MSIINEKLIPITDSGPPAKTAAVLTIFDAGADLTPVTLAAIKTRFGQTGGLHVINTGLRNAAALLPLLPELGFAPHEQFRGGGRTSAAWQEKWAAPGLRHLDYYPPQYALLPNGEINYQREFPARVLFYCERPPESGGRTCLHSSALLEKTLADAGDTGRGLVEKVRKYGLTIEVGFLDEDHPEKASNYYQSWQERFDTKNQAAALEGARALTDEYDECWWKNDNGYPVLMTRITLPGFVANRGDGRAYMRFPRIAMDGPAARNGFRRFPLGSGIEMSDGEKTLLRKAYETTRAGHDWHAGDIILMNNITHAHSREAFVGPREVLVGMAGLERIEDHD